MNFGFRVGFLLPAALHPWTSITPRTASRLQIGVDSKGKVTDREEVDVDVEALLVRLGQLGVLVPR